MTSETKTAVAVAATTTITTLMTALLSVGVASETGVQFETALRKVASTALRLEVAAKLISTCKRLGTRTPSTTTLTWNLAHEPRTWHVGDDVLDVFDPELSIDALSAHLDAILASLRKHLPPPSPETKTPSVVHIHVNAVNGRGPVAGSGTVLLAQDVLVCKGGKDSKHHALLRAYSTEVDKIMVERRETYIEINTDESSASEHCWPGMVVRCSVPSTGYSRPWDGATEHPLFTREI